MRCAQHSRALNSYFTLGRTGLRVSRLALGTMTFGTEWGWGTDKETARELVNTYVDAGGNFFDTADLYTNGTSETWLVLLSQNAAFAVFENHIMKAIPVGT